MLYSSEDLSKKLRGWQHTQVDGVLGCAFTKAVDEDVGVVVIVTEPCTMDIADVPVTTELFFAYYFDHVNMIKTWKYPFDARQAHSSMAFSSAQLDNLLAEVQRLTADLRPSGNVVGTWIESIYGIAPEAAKLYDIINRQGTLALDRFLTVEQRKVVERSRQ